MNILILSGEVSSGITTRSTESGRTVSNFEISETRSKTRHAVACFDKVSDISSKLEIGQQIMIRGKLYYNGAQKTPTVVCDYIEYFDEREEAAEPVVRSVKTY